MSNEEEAELVKAGEEAEVQLRRSLRTVREIIARYRPIFSGRRPAPDKDPASRPLFKFDP